MSRLKRIGLRLAGVPLIGPKAIEMALRRRYGARVVTPAKVRNLVQADRDFRARAVEVSSLPYILKMDTLNACNLKCPFCVTGTGQLNRPPSRLPVGRACAAIDAVREHALECQVFNLGEPFLNPDIFEITRYAVEAGLYTIISSNLSLARPHLAERVVDSGLDLLLVSLDGLTQETLEVYRRGADFERVCENVRRVAKARRRAGLKRPVIQLNFLVFRHNEHELPYLDAMCRRLGADKAVAQRAFVCHDEFLPTRTDFPPQQTVSDGTCAYLYRELTVEADGNVSPCCFNTSTRWDIGRIEDMSDIGAFWNGPAMRAMRSFWAEGPNGEAARSAEILCHHCRYVGPDPRDPGRLSPLPPACVAAGADFDAYVAAGRMGRAPRRTTGAGL